jgi:hypothetical protein
MKGRECPLMALFAPSQPRFLKSVGSVGASPASAKSDPFETLACGPHCRPGGGTRSPEPFEKAVDPGGTTHAEGHQRTSA